MPMCHFCTITDLKIQCKALPSSHIYSDKVIFQVKHQLVMTNTIAFLFFKVQIEIILIVNDAKHCLFSEFQS